MKYSKPVVVNLASGTRQTDGFQCRTGGAAGGFNEYCDTGTGAPFPAQPGDCHDGILNSQWCTNGATPSMGEGCVSGGSVGPSLCDSGGGPAASGPGTCTSGISPA